MALSDIDKYETKGRPIYAKFRGWCCVNEEHEFKRGERLFKVRLKDNPLVVLSGWACRRCTLDMDHGR